MGRIVIVEKNEAGKIELTKEELQKMLDDAYNQGYTDGNRPTTITTSTYWPSPTYDAINTCQAEASS